MIFPSAESESIFDLRSITRKIVAAAPWAAEKHSRNGAVFEMFSAPTISPKKALNSHMLTDGCAI